LFSLKSSCVFAVPLDKQFEQVAGLATLGRQQTPRAAGSMKKFQPWAAFLKTNQPQLSLGF
jgi:hypothetical protein